MKKVVLHIGLGKTGTSSIQASLSANSKFLLSECGILFPGKDYVDSVHNNQNFFLGCLFNMKRMSQTPPCQIRGLTLEKLQRRRPKVMERFKNQVESSGCDTLLLSAEGITDWTGDQVGDLKKWLETFTGDIEIIACLRHPRSYLASWTQQTIKGGESLNSLEFRCNIIKSIMKHHLTHYNRECIKVFDFNEAIIKKGGVLAEFYNQLDLNVSSLATNEEFRINESMSHEATMMLSKFNEKHFKDGLKPGKAFMERLEIMKVPGKKFHLPKTIYDECEAAIQEEVAWVRENFSIEMKDPSSEN